MDQGGGGERDGEEDAEASIEWLPDAILSEVLVAVSRRKGGLGHALVCRRWAALAPGAQACVRVPAGGMFKEARLARELGAFSELRSLVLEPESVVTLSDHFLRRLCDVTWSRLQSLQIMPRAATGTCKFTAQGLSDFFVSSPALRQLSLLAHTSSSIDLPDTISCLRALRRVDLGPDSHYSGLALARGLPPGLWGLGALRHLLLATTSLDVLPGLVSGLSALSSLHITSARLTRLPEELGALTGLRVLRLRCCHLEALPASLSGLSQLTALHLHVAHLSELDTVLRLTALRSLKLSCWSLTDLSAGMSRLAALTELDLHCPKMEWLPDEIAQLKNLRVLRVSRSRLHLLPRGLFSRRQVARQSWEPDCPVPFAALEELSLEVESPTHVDNSALVQLPRLRVLNLSFQGWHVVLPADLGRLTMLQALYLHSTSMMSQLTPSFSRLRALHVLRLHSCYGLQALPYLGALTALREMYLAGCSSLTRIPASVSRLTNLRKLSMFQAHALRELPPELGSLPALELLELRGVHHLAALPESVGQLPCLTELVLTVSWVITALPSTLGALQGLRKLEIGSCPELQSLPDSLGRVTSLRHLLLRDLPKVTAIPESFSALTALRDIRAVNCRGLVFLPPAIVRMPLLLDPARRPLLRLMHSLPDQSGCAERRKTLRPGTRRSRSAKGVADVALDGDADVAVSAAAGGAAVEGDGDAEGAALLDAAGADRGKAGGGHWVLRPRGRVRTPDIAIRGKRCRETNGSSGVASSGRAKMEQQRNGRTGSKG